MCIRDRYSRDVRSKNLNCSASASSFFPEQHSGIGQVNAAIRGFQGAMSDILSHSVFQKVKFISKINQRAAVVPDFKDQISAPFTWKTEGMISLGYSNELEFNGLIYCSFCKEGISSANLSFDVCTLVRQFNTSLLR